jgi:hypothetical protein
LAIVCIAAALPLAFSAGSVLAQSKPSYEPKDYQAGKDVVWVPTAQALVDKMLDMAETTPSDFVIDLGSGDGRTVITAAKRGINALGIEYNPDMVALSQRTAEKEGVSDKAKFVKADLFETDFSRATVITMFLLSDINLRLRPKILDMKPGTRVVSNTFDMGDWKPDETFRVSDGCERFCNAFFWVVPAKVGGTWKTTDGELNLKQEFQFVTGTLKTGNVTAPISDGKLTGNQIKFTAGGTEYTGTVNGNTIEGVSKSGTTEGKWSVTRGA